VLSTLQKRLRQQLDGMRSGISSYRRSDLRADVNAGLTVGFMLIPQGMAYALLAGLPPIYGLYAGLVPALVYGFLGGIPRLSIGPTALVSILILTGLSGLAETGTDRFLQLALLTGFLAGLIQLLLGFVRLGFLINFVSHPVLSGFTSAAAIIIAISQFKYLLGLDLNGANGFVEMSMALIQALPESSWPTLIFSGAALLLLLLLRRFARRLPGPLLLMVISIASLRLLGTERWDLDLLGNVPAGLPILDYSWLRSKDMAALFPMSLTIAIISFIESLAIAKALGSKRIQPDRELIALGAGKVAGAFYGAFPTTGSFSRSAVNADAGARSPLSGLVMVVLIALTLLFLTPFFYYLPKALLGVIIIIAVVKLIRYDEAISLWNRDRRDFWTLIVTFLITLLAGIQAGIATGVLLSLGLMVYRNARPHYAILGRLPETGHYRNVDRFDEAIKDEEVLVFRFDAQLYFGNADHFQQVLEDRVRSASGKLEVMVLDASNMHDIDSTGIQVLREFMSFLKERHIAFYLAGGIGPTRDALIRHKLIEEIGIEYCFLSVADATQDYYDHKHDRSRSNPSRVLQERWSEVHTNKNRRK